SAHWSKEGRLKPPFAGNSRLSLLQGAFPSPPVDKSTSVHFRSPYLLYLTPVQSNSYVSKQSLSPSVASSFNDQRLANFALLHCDKSTSAHWCSLCFLYLIAKRSSLYVAERSFQLSVLRVHLADLVLEFGVTDVVVVAHFFVDDAVWCYFNESVGDGVNEFMVMGCEQDRSFEFNESIV